MGKQRRLAKPVLPARATTSDATPTASGTASPRRPGQRDEGRARLDDLQAELPGQVIGITGRTHFRDARPAGCDDQARGGKGLAAACDVELGAVMGDALDRLAQRDLDRSTRADGLVAFVEQHRDDLPRRAVAEQLAQRLFMPGDAISLDQSRKSAACSGPAPTWRNAGWPTGSVGRGADIGEVAPPAARDEDLLPRRIGMVDDHNAPPPLPGGRRRHKPRRPCAEDDCVILLHGGGLGGIGEDIRFF